MWVELGLQVARILGLERRFQSLDCRIRQRSAEEFKRLQQALDEVRQLQKRYCNIHLADKSRTFNYDLQDALELENMLRTAEAIVFSALQRQESRGAHFRSDYPERNDEGWLRHSLVFVAPEGLKIAYKPVSVSRFTPEKRRY